MSVDARLARAGAALQAEQFDVYLATKTADIRWLTGFSRVFDLEQAHVLLVIAGHLAGGSPQLWLHTDTRYSGAMRPLMAGVLDKLDDERKTHSRFLAESAKALMLATRTPPEPLRIGIEADLPLFFYRALTKALDEALQLPYQLVEKLAFVEALRAVKDDAEIATMRHAQSITDAGLMHMLEYLKPGLTEVEAAIELEFYMRSHGSEGLAFDTILASGPNSAVPHAIPGSRVLQRGDFVLMDFGAKYDDYRSDMTRTVVLGQADERQRLIYETVLQAQTEAIAMVRPGLDQSAPQTHVNELFAAAGFGDLMHGLGHGVGIDIHELPVLGLRLEGQLEVGNVVTVEPGIYEEGFGGVRIEDYGVVTPTGYDDFTQSPKSLIEL